MTSNNLVRFLRLLEPFNAAASQQVAETEDADRKFIEALSADDLALLARCSENIPCGFEHCQPEDFTEQTLRSILLISDMAAKAQAHVLGIERVAAIFPRELKNAQDADELRRIGAVNYSRLCMI